MHSGSRYVLALSEVPAGIVLQNSVIDDAGVLLLAANQVVTSEHIASLRQRGVLSVELHPRDFERLSQRHRGKSRSGSASKLPRGDDLWKSNDSLCSKMPNRFGEDVCPNRQQRITTVFRETASNLLKIGRLIVSDSLQALLPLRQVSRRFAELLVDDVDQVVGSLLVPTSDFDLPTRITQLAGLSMAMSIELKMPAAATMEIGLAAILHDLSLLQMSPQLRSPASTLSAVQWKEYSEHPTLSRQMIESLELPHAIRLTVAQVHEQLDGSGYPHGLVDSRIHPYAKVINVADAYLRIIGPGPGRPPVAAHDAIGVILHTQRRKLFDASIVRSLIQLVTLFPLGTEVELSDGRVAQVIRRPQRGYGEPIVRIDSPDAGSKIVPLETSNLKVLRPIVDRQLGQLRLSQDIMKSNVWHPSNF